MASFCCWSTAVWLCSRAVFSPCRHRWGRRQKQRRAPSRKATGVCSQVTSDVCKIFFFANWDRLVAPHQKAVPNHQNSPSLCLFFFEFFPPFFGSRCFPRTIFWSSAGKSFRLEKFRVLGRYFPESEGFDMVFFWSFF